MGSKEIPCYVLDDGRRIISSNAAIGFLTEERGGGNLENYLKVESLRGFVPPGFRDEMIEFFIPGTSLPNTTTRGISAESFIEICQAYVSAFESNALTTDRQKEIAICGSNSVDSQTGLAASTPVRSTGGVIYEYLDADVAQWLRENAPKPLKGQNYHQWMSEQYGLKRLIEHIWKVIGIASTCADIKDLKHKMEELCGKRQGFQYALKLVPPGEARA